MTRILLTAATLIGLTSAALAQGYDYDSAPHSYGWRSHVYGPAANYGGPYGQDATPNPDGSAPSVGD